MKIEYLVSYTYEKNERSCFGSEVMTFGIKEASRLVTPQDIGELRSHLKMKLQCEAVIILGFSKFEDLMLP